jgi:hypothetical protein
VHVVERAVTVGIIGDRARKQLIPAGKLGQLPFDVHRESALRLR